MQASRIAGVLFVLLFHGLAAWLAWRILERQPRGEPERPWVAVRLVPQHSLDPKRLAVRRESPRSVPRETSSTEPALPEPAIGAEEGARERQAPGIPAAAGDAPGAASMNLRPSTEVLRGSLAHPATQDPRANSPRPTAEERMAMAFDATQCLKEERRPDGAEVRSMRRLTGVISAIEARTGHKGLDVWVCE